MRVLIISDEVWNDTLSPNNVISNWFEGTDYELANICLCPGLPQNNCCNKYFQITDGMMVKSILSKNKAGRILADNERYVPTKERYNSTDVKKIEWMRKYCPSFLRFCKGLVWGMGKIDEEMMCKFIEEFNPDIIFSPRLATTKLIRIESLAFKYAKCPIVASTGDNEYSLKRVGISPFFWINAFRLRHAIRKMMPNYSLYYTLSEDQKSEYEKCFDTKVEVLRKCGDFSKEYEKKDINSPIRMVYAGKLYVNRWKTLAKIGEALKKINTDGVKMVLDIYTKDVIPKSRRKRLDDGVNIFIKGAVAPSDLIGIYKNADIALHVESFDLKPRYATRLSFSTKIIDCLASSCALMVFAWREHTGYKYLKTEDAAICVDSLKDIYLTLKDLCDNPQKIQEYQKKAWLCGQRNHNKENVQQLMRNDFEDILERSV